MSKYAEIEEEFVSTTDREKRYFFSIIWEWESRRVWWRPSSTCLLWIPVGVVWHSHFLTCEMCVQPAWVHLQHLPTPLAPFRWAGFFSYMSINTCPQWMHTCQFLGSVWLASNVITFPLEGISRRGDVLYVYIMLRFVGVCGAVIRISPEADT